MEKARYGLIKVFVLKNKDFIEEQIQNGETLASIWRSLSEKANFEVRYHAFNRAVNKLILHDRTTERFREERIKTSKEEKPTSYLSQTITPKPQSSPINIPEKTEQHKPKEPKIFKPEEKKFKHNSNPKPEDFI